MAEKQIIDWGDHLVELIWLNSNSNIDEAKIATAHGYCFSEKGLLLVESHRGFELPGGHLESGESTLESFIREVYEEACVMVDEVILLGYIQVNFLDWVETTKYPKLSYMAFCKANIKKQEPYQARYECISRVFIEPIDVRKKHYNWLQVYEPSLQLAIA